MSRRMDVGVDAVWGIEFEFELNSPDPAPRRDDASSECRREERPTALDRSRPGEVYGPASTVSIS